MILISRNGTLTENEEMGVKKKGRERKSGIRIIKRAERVVVSFSATLQMNSCNDPETLKRQNPIKQYLLGFILLAGGNDPSLSKGESQRMWVAIVIQMKGRAI